MVHVLLLFILTMASAISNGTIDEEYTTKKLGHDLNHSPSLVWRMPFRATRSNGGLFKDGYPVRLRPYSLHSERCYCPGVEHPNPCIVPSIFQSLAIDQNKGY